MDNYLDVTRVQKALRLASSMNHDVLTDPKTVHLDGKKYGMAVGHTLRLTEYRDRWGDTQHLITDVLQSESPVISTITTAHDLKNGNHSREVEAWIPHPQGGYRVHDEEGSGHDGFFEINNKTGTTGMNTNGVWVPHPAMVNKTVKDIHEHLATHNKIDTSNWHAEGRLKNLGESLKAFSHPLPVFSGLINVEYKTNVGHPVGHPDKDETFQRYIYNPETEQLIKHEGD